MISNFYIADVLQPRCKYFKGVYSSNTMPPKLIKLKRFIIICNLSQEGTKGSHWVTIVKQDKNVLYIDSLGLPCLSKDIQKFLDQALAEG